MAQKFNCEVYWTGVILQNGVLVRHHQDQVRKRIVTSTNFTNSDNCIEEEPLSAPSIVTASAPNDTFSVSSHQNPQQEHRAPLRYRDSGK